MPSWGPGAVIEFFTLPGKRRRELPEDGQENMALGTCASEHHQVVRDSPLASLMVPLFYTETASTSECSD